MITFGQKIYRKNDKVRGQKVRKPGKQALLDLWATEGKYTWEGSFLESCLDLGGLQGKPNRKLPHPKPNASRPQSSPLPSLLPPFPPFPPPIFRGHRNLPATPPRHDPPRPGARGVRRRRTAPGRCSGSTRGPAPAQSARRAGRPAFSGPIFLGTSGKRFIIACSGHRSGTSGYQNGMGQARGSNATHGRKGGRLIRF